MIDINGLNPPQREAVLHTQGPLLILAGAGSGKTRVLTYRIAHLVKDQNVNPYNILAITFTNKAAGEMKERVQSLVGEGSDAIWVSTFHAACVRILRRFIERKATYDRHFSIYDTDDSKSLIKAVCKDIHINTKDIKESAVLNAISSAKNKGINPDEFREQAVSSSYREIARAYFEYQARLIKNNAMDFDDILLRTVELLETDVEVRTHYQDRFAYIHVDEYQDTNLVQFRLIKLLAGSRQNLCVVGDDDQSIYKFRGADITNILNFESSFPSAKVIRLEQNYRSTQNILSAANGVIANNKSRKEKSLWTDMGEGEKIRLRQTDNAYEEGDLISDDIRRRVRNDAGSYKDFAVLYRTNAQSRILEEKFVMKGIPYKVVGGVNFYSRKEIKDILAYLKTVDNGADDLALRRIINVPKRGIGATTINKAAEYAASMNISLYEAMKDASLIPGLGKAGDKLSAFVMMIESLRAGVEGLCVEDLIKSVIETTGYVTALEEAGEEDAKDRIDNIAELVNKAAAFDNEFGADADLSSFLENVALVADIDETDMGVDRVLLMTLHGSKGLEFPHVFMAGMEDGLFPGFGAIMSEDRTEMEEERRLAYVGITRAMKDLTLICSRSRMVNGETRYNNLSRFVMEIPPELFDKEGLYVYKRVEDSRGVLSGTRDNYYSKKVLGEPTVLSYSKRSLSGEGSSTTQREKPKARLGTPQGDKPFIARQVSSLSSLKKGAPTLAGKPDYVPGDRVSHTKFGEGTVLELEETPKDYRVKVEFDTAGTKIMYAGFAKLQKV